MLALFAMLGLPTAEAEGDKAKVLRKLVESKQKEVSERYGQLSPETFSMYKEDEEYKEEREYFSGLQSIEWGASENSSVFPVLEILDLYPEYLPVLPSRDEAGEAVSKAVLPEMVVEEWRPSTEVLNPTEPSRLGQSGNNSRECYAGLATGISFAYRARMRVKLTGFTLYPKAVAEEHGIQGNVLIGFVVDRGGMLVETGILQSSGHEVLDRAVEQMVQMAQPFETFSDDVKCDKVGFAFPFSIRLKK